eukprot:GHVH01011576.1.p1 GENE.GHVH01011576.1~~GHVH01011576.1.p1  ORF type:complete len:517 (+),score=77.61 GHVH01011576.1:262-1812(+)
MIVLFFYYWSPRCVVSDSVKRDIILNRVLSRTSDLLACLSIYKSYQKDIQSQTEEDCLAETLKLIEVFIDQSNSEVGKHEIVGTKKTSNIFNTKAKLESWASMPVDELQERMNKGEQLNVDEWMPNDGGRRPLLSHEVKEHLQFGNRIKSEGNGAMVEYRSSKNADLSLSSNCRDSLDLAKLRYKQGIRLMEWVMVDKEDLERDTLQWELDEMENSFHRNYAIACYEDGSYHDAIDSCTFVLDKQPDDGKARYRRGLCYMRQSSVLLAKNDFVILVNAADNSTSNAAGRRGLQELRRVVSEWKTDGRKLMESIIRDGTFSNDRCTGNSELNDNTIQPIQSIAMRCAPKQPLEVMIRSQRDVVQALERVLPPAKQRMDCEQMTILLIDMLDYYCSEDISSLLNKMRIECDFDAKRFIYRARIEILPRVAEHVFAADLVKTVGCHSPEKLNAYFRQSVIYHIALGRLLRFELYQALQENDEDSTLQEFLDENPVEIEELWSTINNTFWGDINKIDEEL